MMEAPLISAKYVLFEALLLLTYFYACEGMIEGDVILDHQPGDGPRNGVVTVFLDGEWQPISAEGFDQTTASVICHSAGFPGVGTPHERACYLSAPPTLRVTCTGSEDTLMECSRVHIEDSLSEVSVSYPLTHMWDNYDAAYVECNETIMAVTGSSPGTNQSLVIPLVVSCLIVIVAVVIVACFLHRCDLRRKMNELTMAPAKKEQGVIEMEDTEFGRQETAPHAYQPPGASSSRTEPEVKEEVNAGAATVQPLYSSKVYNEIEPKVKDEVNEGAANYSSKVYKECENPKQKPAEHQYATCQ